MQPKGEFDKFIFIENLPQARRDACARCTKPLPAPPERTINKMHPDCYKADRAKIKAGATA